VGNYKGLENLVHLKHHYTYSITCLVNGKIYVGRHSTNNIDDGYMGSGKLLKRAMKKYGEEKFIKIILAFYESIEDCVKAEIQIVTQDFASRSNTYNIVVGGDNPRMYGKDNPSWKGGISKLPYIKKGKADQSGENNPMYGKTHTKEVREFLRGINIGRPPKNKGIKLTQEERQRHIFKQESCKSITINGVEFPSIRSASRLLEVSQGTIQARLWSKNYKDYDILNKKVTEIPTTDKIEYVKNKLKIGTERPVVQLTKMGEYIAEYPSAKDASRKTKAHDGDIIACCRRSKKSDGYAVKSAGGYVWIYQEEYKARGKKK
tara:strand:+ start:932 stop:1888 length:957 start_codon:yes stop_codon:yes gene_type:complete